MIGFMVPLIRNGNKKGCRQIIAARANGAQRLFTGKGSLTDATQDGKQSNEHDIIRDARQRKKLLQGENKKMSNAFETLKNKWDYDGNSIVHDLITIADYYRFALSQFLKYPLAFGHSTVSAQEDASLLILLYLKLPIEDGIEHWGACRLTKYEREKLSTLIGRRIIERVPVAYLLNSCYQQGELFYVDNRVLIPRSHIGEILHSYPQYCQQLRHPPQQLHQDSDSPSELQYDDYFPTYSSSSGSSGSSTDNSDNSLPTSSPLFLPAAAEISDVLDLCTGSGCLAVLAARQFMTSGATVSALPALSGKSRRLPGKHPLHIDAVDISRDALGVAEVNVNNKSLQSVISLYLGDLYSALPAPKLGSSSRVRQYDLIICNPPYVVSNLLRSLPKEYLHEPTSLALDGGENGLQVVERVLRGAFEHLKDNGGLILEVGTGKEALIRHFPKLFKDEDSAALLFPTLSSPVTQRVLWIATSNSEDEVCFIPKQYLSAQYLE